jgi:hypothetical protein
MFGKLFTNILIKIAANNICSRGEFYPMKKTFFLLTLISLLSCNNDDDDDDIYFSNELKKRVLLIESYDPYVTSFVSDSIIEYYEDRLIVRRDYFAKQDKESGYVPYFNDFEYDMNNLLIKVNYYNDDDLSEKSSTLKYSYNGDNSIRKIEFQKTSPSNLSEGLYSFTYDYEYKSDTIKLLLFSSRNNQISNAEITYVVKGNLDTVFSVESNTMYLFNEQNDLYKTKYLGKASDQYFSYETNIRYGDNRQTLITNFFGTKLNAFIAYNPIIFNSFELSDSYTEEYYYKGDRADNFRIFNYTFDENNRLSEVKTSGSFAANQTIQYFYE